MYSFDLCKYCFLEHKTTPWRKETGELHSTLKDDRQIWLWRGLIWLWRGLIWLLRGLIWLLRGLIWLLRGPIWLWGVWFGIHHEPNHTPRDRADLALQGADLALERADLAMGGVIWDSPCAKSHPSETGLIWLSGVWFGIHHEPNHTPRDRADLALERADLALGGVIWDSPCTKSHPPETGLIWLWGCDLGFTICQITPHTQISPLQQFIFFLFPKPHIRQNCCLNQ